MEKRILHFSLMYSFVRVGLGECLLNETVFKENSSNENKDEMQNYASRTTLRKNLNVCFRCTFSKLFLYYQLYCFEECGGKILFVSVSLSVNVLCRYAYSAS